MGSRPFPASRLLARMASPLTVLLVAVYAWRFLFPLFASSPPPAEDFQDYLYAARQIATGGDPYGDFVRTHVPWDWSLSSGYLYPPAFAVFLVPLTWLSSEVAVRVWVLAVQAMVGLSLIVVYRALGRPGRAELLCMVAVTTTFFPLAATAWTGAMNPLLLLMLTAAWALWRRRREVASGILIGAAAVFKVFPIALVPYFAARRQGRLLAALLLTGTAGILLGLAVTSWEHNLFYFQQMVPHLSAGTGYRENQSLAGFAARLCDPTTAERGGAAGWCGRALAWPAAAGVIALVILACRRGTRPDLEFGLAVSALPLVSSVTWGFHLVILLFPIALLSRHLFRSRAVPRWRMRLLMLAWICFALLPPLRYAAILHPLPGLAGSAVTRVLIESYLVGTLILFATIWSIVRKGNRAEQAPASLQRAA